MRRYLLLIFFSFVCLSGCDKGGRFSGSDNRFWGKWTFDRDYTQAHLPREAIKSPSVSPAPKSSPSDAAETAWAMNGMLDSMKPMLAEQLIGQLDGQSFTLTPKLLTDSAGQSKTYQIIERPTANDMSLKLSDGTIWTATLEDGRMILPTSGGIHFKLYFRRVSQ